MFFVSFYRALRFVVDCAFCIPAVGCVLRFRSLIRFAVVFRFPFALLRCFVPVERSYAVFKTFADVYTRVIGSVSWFVFVRVS